MGSGVLKRLVRAVLVPLDSAAILMGVDTCPGEEAGDSCSVMEEDIEGKIAALVVMVVLSGWIEAAIEVVAEG